MAAALLGYSYNTFHNPACVWRLTAYLCMFTVCPAWLLGCLKPDTTTTALSLCLLLSADQVLHPTQPSFFSLPPPPSRKWGGGRGCTASTQQPKWLRGDALLHGTKTVALCHSLGKPLRVQMKEHNNNNNRLYIYGRAKSHAKSAHNSSSHTCTGQSASICMQIKPPTGADIWCSSALWSKMITLCWCALCSFTHIHSEEQNISNDGRAEYLKWRLSCCFYTSFFLIIFSIKTQFYKLSCIQVFIRHYSFTSLFKSNQLHRDTAITPAALKTKLETQNQIHKNVAHFNHESKATEQKMGAGLLFCKLSFPAPVSNHLNHCKHCWHVSRQPQTQTQEPNHRNHATNLTLPFLLREKWKYNNFFWSPFH